MLTLELPQKQTKSVDLEGPLHRLIDAKKANPAQAKPGASALHKSRLQLADVKLSSYTAEAAAKELMAYALRLERLSRRLDDCGAGLRIDFAWRDAWKKSKSHEGKPDFDWERCCMLFNAAAANCYCAIDWQKKGPAQGGLKKAVHFFQNAAGCLQAAHDIVRPLIFGLAPRWPPSSLTLDVSIEVLVGLRDLMLAQAQRAFFEKAKAEGLPDGITSKLAAQAADLFGAALGVFSQGEVKEMVCVDGGVFSKDDKSWLSRIGASQLHMRSLAEEISASEAAAKHDYGTQVARLQCAHGSAAEAKEAAEGAHLSGSEKKELSDRVSLLKHLHADALNKNTTIYQEVVPPAAALPKIEPKSVVKPTPPAEEGLEPDPFVGLLPTPLAAKLDALHEGLQSRLHSTTAQASADAAAAESRLAALSLPQTLEAACGSDKQLPPRLLTQIMAAQPLGGAAKLQDLLDECKALERAALDSAETADMLYKAEENTDKDFFAKNPKIQPATLKSTETLVMAVSEFAHTQANLKKAVQITADQQARFDKAKADIVQIDAPCEELEARLPHKDGTALEVEPCVPALQALLSQLDEVKSASNAALAEARGAMRQQREQLVEAGEKLLLLPAEGGAMIAPERLKTGDMDDALEPYKAPMAAVENQYEAQQQHRLQLLEEIAVQNSIFVKAQRDATSYPEREEYFRSLSQGASEAQALHDGLTQGRDYYKQVQTSVQRQIEAAQKIADDRDAERRAAVRRLEAAANFGTTPPPPAPTFNPATNSYQPQSQLNNNSLAAAQAAWRNSHQPASSAPPVAVAQARPYVAPQPTPYAPPQPAAPAPPKQIMCFQCRNKFGVPPGTSVVACPFCRSHNRVPT